jgi:hypothetical protein
VAGYNGGSSVDSVKALFQTAGCERVDVY